MAEWSIKLGSAALIENIATETRSWVSADYTTLAIQPSPQVLRFLLEELVVSHVFADLDVAAFFAEIQDFGKQRVIASRELFLEADPSSLNSYLNDSVTAKELVEAQFFSSVFFEDLPVLNDIYQFVVTLHVLQAGDKNYLSTQRDHLVVRVSNATNLLRIHLKVIRYFFELVLGSSFEKLV